MQRPDLSGIVPPSLPEPSQLKGVPGYLKEYNRLYAELAEAIRGAVGILATKYNVGFIGTNPLAGLNLRLAPTEDKDKQEPFQFVVSEANPFYPEGAGKVNYIMPRLVFVPNAQLAQLVSDIILSDKVLRGVYREVLRYDLSDSQNLHVNMQHDIGIRDGSPHEYFRFGVDGLESILQQPKVASEIPPYITVSSPIAPDNLTSETSNVSRVNESLATFASTESANYIPAGCNRLQLINAAVYQLIAKIKEREGRVDNERKRLATIKGHEELRQRRLPGL